MAMEEPHESAPQPTAAPHGPPLPPSTEVVTGVAEGVWRKFVAYTAGTLPLPSRRAALDRLLYGLAQPVLGLRVLAADRALLREGLQPALLLGTFCALLAMLGDDSWGEFPRKFYRTFVALAPVPSILFANHYSRLAAFAHRSLGLGACDLRRGTLWQAFLHALMQAIIVTIALAPLFALLTILPLLGKALAATVGALWALHWVVVEAFDSARVIYLTSAPQQPAPAEVWFVRASLRLGERLPYIGALLRLFGRACRRLSAPWREEILLTERHRGLVFGFALTTAALLAIPFLNLLFRPIIIVASVHLLARLRAAGEATDSAPDPALGDSKSSPT